MSILDNLTAEGQARRVEQTDPPRSPRETLPTMYDLPSEDPEEPGLPDEFHDLQPQLLSRTLRLSRYSRDNCFTASDLNLYYDVAHPLWQKRPDWFLVVGVPRLYEGQELRRSYVVWQEGKFPSVIVEFLSPGTEVEDLGRFHSAATATTSPELNGESSQNKTSRQARGLRAVFANSALHRLQPLYQTTALLQAGGWTVPGAGGR